jgi:hypothetical protein
VYDVKCYLNIFFGVQGQLASGMFICKPHALRFSRFYAFSLRVGAVSARMGESSTQGDQTILNLSQRLILGCVLIAGLTFWLAAATHRALAAGGKSGLAYGLVAAVVLVEAVMVYFVLRPIHTLAQDARKIAQGNLEHRV